jgi:hypothetical protein
MDSTTASAGFHYLQDPWGGQEQQEQRSTVPGEDQHWRSNQQCMVQLGILSWQPQQQANIVYLMQTSSNQLHSRCM